MTQNKYNKNQRLQFRPGRGLSEEQGAIQYLQIKYCAHSQCVVSEVYVYRDEVMGTTYLLYFVVTSRSDATAIRCCDQTDTSLSV